MTDSSSTSLHWNQLCQCIKGLCTTVQGGLLLADLENDFRSLKGTPIPYREFGFSSLRELLENDEMKANVVILPRHVAIEQLTLNPRQRKMLIEQYDNDNTNSDWRNDEVVYAISDPNMAHITRLVNSQEPSRRANIGGTVFRRDQVSSSSRQGPIPEFQPMNAIVVDQSGTNASVQIRQPINSANRVTNNAPYRTENAAAVQSARNNTGQFESNASRSESSIAAPQSQRLAASSSTLESHGEAPLELLTEPNLTPFKCRIAMNEEMAQFVKTDEGKHLWRMLYTLIRKYTDGLDDNGHRRWLPHEAVPALWSYHFFGTPINLSLVGGDPRALIVCFQEWLSYSINPLGDLCVSCRRSSRKREELKRYRDETAIPTTENLAAVEFAIHHMEDFDHSQELEELEYFEIPPINEKLEQDLKKMKLPIPPHIVRKQVYWLILSHFPLTGCTVSQIERGYQLKYPGQNIQKDYLSNIDKCMTDILIVRELSPVHSLIEIRLDIPLVTSREVLERRYVYERYAAAQIRNEQRGLPCFSYRREDERSPAVRETTVRFADEVEYHQPAITADSTAAPSSSFTAQQLRVFKMMGGVNSRQDNQAKGAALRNAPTATEVPTTAAPVVVKTTERNRSSVDSDLGERGVGNVNVTSNVEPRQPHFRRQSHVNPTRLGLAAGQQMRPEPAAQPTLTLAQKEDRRIADIAAQLLRYIYRRLRSIKSNVWFDDVLIPKLYKLCVSDPAMRSSDTASAILPKITALVLDEIRSRADVFQWQTSTSLNRMRFRLAADIVTSTENSGVECSDEHLSTYECSPSLAAIMDNLGGSLDPFQTQLHNESDLSAVNAR